MPSEDRNVKEGKALGLGEKDWNGLKSVRGKKDSPGWFVTPEARAQATG